LTEVTVVVVGFSSPSPVLAPMMNLQQSASRNTEQIFESSDWLAAVA